MMTAQTEVWLRINEAEHRRKIVCAERMVIECKTQPHELEEGHTSDFCDPRSRSSTNVHEVPAPEA